MDQLDFTGNNNAAQADQTIELDKMNLVEVKITLLNSVASEVHDLFETKEPTDKVIKVGDKSLTVGEFVVTLCKDNKLDNLLLIFGTFISQRATLKEAVFQDTEKFEYIPRAARVKIVGTTEIEITNLGPLAAVPFVGNGEILMGPNSIHSSVFTGNFLLGNLRNDPAPYTAISTKNFKTVPAGDIVIIDAFKTQFSVPMPTTKHLWMVLNGKGGAKRGNASVANIPWIMDGEKPVAVSTALSTIYSNLLTVCDNMRTDEILYNGEKVKAWKFVPVWLSQRLCNEKSEVYNQWLSLAREMSKFKWETEVTAEVLDQLPILCMFAGKFLTQCRGVRGRDNPGLEYGPWTLMENLPWGFVGLLRHRMFCENAKIVIECVLKSTPIDNSFVAAVTVNGLVMGWEEKISTTKGPIFIYGEDLKSTAYFGAAVIRSADLDEIAGVWLLQYVAELTKRKRLIVLRMLLPQNAGQYDKFITILKELATHGGLFLHPGVTPHNCEAYLIYVPGNASTPVDLKNNVLWTMYHMYKSSILTNYARTVSYCMMIPANLGKAMFFPVVKKRWDSYCLSCYKGHFYIDVNSKVKVHKAVSIDDNVRPMETVEIGSVAENGFSATKRQKVQE